jgi:hypothetical protein
MTRMERRNEMRFSHAERFGNMNLKNLKLKSNNYNFKVL